MFLGGIGFFVIENILTCIKERKMNKVTFQTKFILYTNAIILVISIILIKILEPKLPLIKTIFTSVALRSTGFSTIDIASCSSVTRIIFCTLMFIGGAPGSTSGGIKINVFTILVLTVITILKDKKQVIVFYRRISGTLIKKAMTIALLSAFIILFSACVLMQFENLELEDTIFHTIAAFSEVGLSYINFNDLSIIGQGIIMILMFIGRIGPISAVGLFVSEKKQNENITYPDANIVL